MLQISKSALAQLSERQSNLMWKRARPRQWDEDFGISLTAPSSTTKSTKPMSSTTVSANEQVLPAPVVQVVTLGSHRQPRRSARFSRFSAFVAGLKERLGTPTAASTSSSPGDRSAAPSSSGHQKTLEPNDDNGEVDEIVVERVWSEGLSSISPSEHGASPEKSGGSYRNTTSTEQESLLTPTGFWVSFPLLVALRWKIWPTIVNFFCSRFPNEKTELHYRQETWYIQKVSDSMFPAVIHAHYHTAPRPVDIAVLHIQLGFCHFIHFETTSAARQDIFGWGK